MATAENHVYDVGGCFCVRGPSCLLAPGELKQLSLRLLFRNRRDTFQQSNERPLLLRASVTVFPERLGMGNPSIAEVVHATNPKSITTFSFCESLHSF